MSCTCVPSGPGPPEKGSRRVAAPHSVPHSVLMAAAATLLRLCCPGDLLVFLAVLLLTCWVIALLRARITGPPGPPGPTGPPGPPGPRPLPLIGNLLQLGLTAPAKTLIELSKTYGPVFSVYMGPRKVVVLVGYKTVKEALVKFDGVFGERDPVRVFDDSSQGHGVLWANGDSWREMRRFTLSMLRDFGMGRRACEDKIIQESHSLVRLLETFGGRPFDTTRPLNCAASNIICSIIYDCQFQYDDPEFTALVDRLHRKNLLSGSALVQLYNLFPSLFGWSAARWKILEIAEEDRKQNLSLFGRLKDTLDPQTCRCFVDAFLVQKQKLEDAGLTDTHFHDENLMLTVVHLFAAGTETSSTTLRWGLLLMAMYPHIQDQVQEELRSVLRGRQVRVEDRKDLHFTNAVIHETQRLANLIPTSLPHRTAQDVVFQGHFIQKGTVVLPLLESVLYDEAEWERPRSFHPAHFLDPDGKFVKRDAFLPFSAGRRVCLGEGLARMELFLFFSTLLQRFRFAPPPGVSEDQLDLSACGGVTYGPAPHRLCAVPLQSG